MRPVAISAVLLGVAHVSLGAAAMPADGGQRDALARAGASTFLEVPDAGQPELLPVGDGGEGGRGRWRRGHAGYGYGWGPPPGYYYAPPPRRYYRPPPPVYYAPPPPVYYAPPPPLYFAPQPGVSLNFRF